MMPEVKDALGQETRQRARTVSLVLPCLNEADSVALCVKEALTALDAAGIPGEVVVVDNGSTDGSAELAQQAGARVVHERKKGYGAALLAGFKAAQNDIIVMADADYTYDFTKLPQLVAPVANDEADLVLGARLDAATRKTMPFLHRFVGTPALTFLAARACGRRVVSDSQSGYRAFRRDALPTLALRSTGMELASEMLIRAARTGMRIEEVQTGYRPRIGDSKLSTFRDGLRHLEMIMLLAPDLALIGPGLTVFALGVVLTIMSFVAPNGVDIGSLHWQPVFFSSIALVLGLQALLAGAILAYNSSVTAAGVQRRFAFVGRLKFSTRCIEAGALSIVAGAVINVVLFFTWVDSGDAPHQFNWASLAQSLIIIGGTLLSFGVIARVQRARAVRHLDGA
jgi:glycosyltransferase involved in cell wall biosynthesis